jgi:hypothetical protein
MEAFMSRIMLGTICGLVYGALSAASMIPLSFPDKTAALTGAFLNRNASGKHPELVLSICRHWSRSSNPHTGWIVKEGLRKLKESRPRDVSAILEILELSD